MSLLIADPTSPVTTFSNGVKAIRLADFVGPSRASLSTISDPLSICGTVVRDEQQLAYTGTDPNKTISATTGQDSVRIHMNDLALDARYSYRGYLSARCLGDIDQTKRNSSHTFLQTGSNAAVVFGYTYNAAFTTRLNASLSSLAAPKPLTNPYYKIIDMGGQIFWGTFTEGQVWLVLRACTGVGGTFVWLIDCLWLVPTRAGGSPYSNNDFRQLLHEPLLDPVYDIRTDTYDITNDDVSLAWTDGQYSTMVGTPAGYTIARPSFADYQIGNNEKTVRYLTDTFTNVDWQADPPSDLTLVIGSHYVPSHRIDSDSFNRSTNPALNSYLGRSDQFRSWVIDNNHPMQASGGYIYCDGSNLVFYRGKYDNVISGLTFDFPTSGSPVDQFDPVSVDLGVTNESGTGSTTLGHESFVGMNHAIAEVKVMTDWILVAGFQMGLGFNTQTSAGWAGVVLDIPSQGSFGLRNTGPMDAYIIYYPGSVLSDRGTFSSTTAPKYLRLDGPLNLTSAYSPNTWVRLKVEIRWYKLRAKVWFDGDPEPSDWQLEAHLPDGYLTSSPYTIYSYPYDSSPNKGRGVRSKSTVSLPFLFALYYRPIEDTTGQSMRFSSNPVRLSSTYWDDFTLDYEAYGSTPKDIHIELKKYTDSPNYGNLTIPYQAQRIGILETGQYVFNTDQYGPALTLWKESGSPDTQAAVVGDTWQKMWRGSKIAVYELVPTK